MQNITKYIGLHMVSVTVAPHPDQYEVSHVANSKLKKLAKVAPAHTLLVKKVRHPTHVDNFA